MLEGSGDDARAQINFTRHGVSPVKSLFFSAMACYKNFGAFTVFGLAWTGVFVLAAVLVSLIATLLGNPMLATVAMFPVALVIVAMFFTSIYFTFLDCFSETDEPLPDELA